MIIFWNHAMSFFVPITLIFNIDPFLRRVSKLPVFCCVLRIANLDSLPEIWSVRTAKQLFHVILAAFLQLLFCAPIIVYTRCTVAIKIKSHSDYLNASTGLPAFP